MASLRKRYSAVSVERPDSPPVAATPVAAAKPPPAAEAPKPLEELAPEKSPSDEAANNAIKARLAEMNRAETLQRAPPVQHYERVESRPPEPAADPVEAAIAAMPPRVQRWYRTNPELLTNPEFAARVQYCHHVAAREVGQQFTDPYFDRMESLLGFRQQQQPKPSNNGHAAPAAPRPASAAPAAPPRNGAAPRQQQYNGHVSAPPTRDVPSMASGRPVGRRVPLTADELQIAKNSGISPEEYSIQKEKMARLRAAGAVQ
jgi:hypothetical protein